MRDVFTELAPEVHRLLRDAAHLDPFHRDLAGVLGHRHGVHWLDQLTRAGILLPATTDGHGYRMVPVVASVARRRFPLNPAGTRRLHARAAPWYAEHGFPRRGPAVVPKSGVTEAAARILADHGAALLAEGGAGAVADAFQSLPEHARSDDLRLLYGEAQQMRGDFEPALAAYAVLADRQESLAAGLAWRYGPRALPARRTALRPGGLPTWCARRAPVHRQRPYCPPGRPRPSGPAETPRRARTTPNGPSRRRQRSGVTRRSPPRTPRSPWTPSFVATGRQPTSITRRRCTPPRRCATPSR